MQQSITQWRAMGTELMKPWFLGLMADVYGKRQQTDEGLAFVNEALEIVERTRDYFCKPELYRLKGELTLQQESQKSKSKSQKFQILNPKS